jgi:uncharacterized SAM-binding protein YcdF (DUF218 family)
VTVDEAAKMLWDYNHMNHKLEKADAILVLGSKDSRVARYGARLFLDGWAPVIIFSGGRGRLTGDWDKTEAEKFADIAAAAGVPCDKMILEKESTNTGENIDFVRRLIEQQQLPLQKFILVQKPYMERRAWAAFTHRWPGKEVILSTEPVTFDEYPNEEISRDEMINILVGDTERNKLYGDRGWQTPQEVPDDVWTAWQFLIDQGFTKYRVQ